MKACHRCATVVPDTAMRCSACNALLITPPAPVAVAAPAAAAASGATVNSAAHAPALPGDEQFFAPGTLQPVIVHDVPAERPSHRGSTGVIIAIVVALVLAVVGARALTSGSSHPKTPVVLPAQAPSQGLPGSLGAVVRVQAESARQHAFSVLAEATSQRLQMTPGMLDGIDPSFQWLPDTESSTRPSEVSVAPQADGSTYIAISATSRDVCAFGRFQLGVVGQYVTMGNVSSCRAADAPTTGWSTLRGGSASDLPLDQP